MNERLAGAIRLNGLVIGLWDISFLTVLYSFSIMEIKKSKQEGLTG